MSADFDQATAISELGDGVFEWVVPDGWQQGRGAWGGLPIGAMVRSVVMAQADAERLIRSISCQIYAPVLVGSVTITTRLIRRGSAMSTWSASVADESGAMCAQVIAITGVARQLVDPPPYATWSTIVAPKVPDWSQVPVLVLPDFAPPFSRHIEQRLIEGVPMGGGPARALGWVRFPHQRRWSAEQIFALVDAWWPTVLVPMTGMRPMATVNFSAHLLTDPASLTAEQPLVFESFLLGADAGFTSETRRLWTGDGRLVLENLQSIALIQ
ncbi:unannotated protein [freshwater metagenome]|uniref:Unannotated protein n=2 Tax=freshwater metagenome TaxID=449393 RepID=A0A6J6TB86_9ZZZZ|nr:hypothetical protein [Actinomycetota bacterium]MSX13109.1 hypothetical protein [Actinomycetota bacterium]MSY97617.1 hypothetical protein [Actinomycetota bacterium]